MPQKDSDELDETKEMKWIYDNLFFLDKEFAAHRNAEEERRIYTH